MPPISEELLSNFLSGVCTEEEAAIVEAYFEQYPDEVFLLDEYEAAQQGPEVPVSYYEEMREVISAATLPKRRSRMLVLRPYLAAAVALFVFACIWLLRPAGERRNGSPGKQLADIWDGKRNSYSKRLSVRLPDSSEAILAPGTTIRYRRDFGYGNKREVKVEGEVLFTVVKDKQAPFVVTAENVETTVLGTIFQVTAEKSSDRIKVTLMEGNLIVRVEAVCKDSVKKYFLSPGEEFVYGKRNSTAVVQKFAVHGGGYAAHLLKRLPLRQDNPHNWYMFNNQSLAEVFDQLALVYNVDIRYNPADLRNKFFIGKLEKIDSLSKIMRDIGRLNHLSVTLENGEYIVKKQEP
jgi:transmembrane sensor